jgi:hypothetical protein
MPSISKNRRRQGIPVRLLPITASTRCQSHERPKLRKLSENAFAELEDILVDLYKTHQMRLVREFGICFYGVEDW